MTSRILLYIVTRNKQTLNYEILSTDSESIKPLIIDVVPNIDIQDQCQVLYTQYILLHSEYRNIFTFLETDIADTVDLVYFCFVPFGLKVQNSYFLPVKQNEIFNRHIRQILNVA